MPQITPTHRPSSQSTQGWASWLGYQALNISCSAVNMAASILNGDMEGAVASYDNMNNITFNSVSHITSETSTVVTEQAKKTFENAKQAVEKRREEAANRKRIQEQRRKGVIAAAAAAKAGKARAAKRKAEIERKKKLAAPLINNACDAGLASDLAETMIERNQNGQILRMSKNPEELAKLMELDINSWIRSSVGVKTVKQMQSHLKGLLQERPTVESFWCSPLKWPSLIYRLCVPAPLPAGSEGFIDKEVSDYNDLISLMEEFAKFESADCNYLFLPDDPSGVLKRGFEKLNPIVQKAKYLKKWNEGNSVVKKHFQQGIDNLVHSLNYHTIYASEIKRQRQLLVAQFVNQIFHEALHEPKMLTGEVTPSKHLDEKVLADKDVWERTFLGRQDIERMIVEIRDPLSSDEAIKHFTKKIMNDTISRQRFSKFLKDKLSEGIPRLNQAVVAELLKDREYLNLSKEEVTLLKELAKDRNLSMAQLDGLFKKISQRDNRFVNRLKIANPTYSNLPQAGLAIDSHVHHLKSLKRLQYELKKREAIFKNLTLKGVFTEDDLFPQIKPYFEELAKLPHYQKAIRAREVAREKEIAEGIASGEILA